jgi:hypothetical protein
MSEEVNTEQAVAEKSEAPKTVIERLKSKIELLCL